MQERCNKAEPVWYIPILETAKGSLYYSLVRSKSSIRDRVEESEAV